MQPHRVRSRVSRPQGRWALENGTLLKYTAAWDLLIRVTAGQMQARRKSDQISRNWTGKRTLIDRDTRLHSNHHAMAIDSLPMQNAKDYWVISQVEELF